jgi:hypothetical protein
MAAKRHKIRKTRVYVCDFCAFFAAIKFFAARKELNE